MIKRFTPPLLILLGLLFSVISAKAETIGLKNDNTVVNQVPTVTTITPYTIDGITLAVESGSQKTASDKDRKLYWGSKSTTTTFTKTVTVNRSLNQSNNAITAISNDYWTGVSLNIGKDKKFNLTSFCIDIAADAVEWKIKAEIINGDGTVLYTIKEQTIKTQSDTKIQLKGDELGLSLTNKAYIKLYYCVTDSKNTSKYIVIPEMSVTGTLEANQQTQYTQPAITQGAYDRTTATYAVTLSTQNEEEGTINYTIGDGAQVKGAASGTVVNVPINTTVKATVSGDSYTESTEASLTTSDMPTLATPTYTIQAYDFEKGQYTVSLSATEGVTIKYTVDGGTVTDYTDAFTVAPNKEVKAHAVQDNMKNSATLTFSTAAAPTDGTHTTPQKNIYTDGMVYDAGAYSITNSPNYIGGTISSNTSKINNAIKMRISRNADLNDFTDKFGFHLDVNKGYTITSVKLQMLNNYNTDIALKGVYADNATTENLLSEEVKLNYGGGKDANGNTIECGEVAIAEVNDIAATDRIVFVFDKNSGTDNPNQAQILITVTYKVPEYITINQTAGYGTMYYEKELKAPEGTKAYTAVLNGNTLNLTELADGIIPAKTAVLVSGNSGVFTYSNTGATFEGKNDLKGTATDIATSSVEGGIVCTLAYENNKTGFYQYTGETLNANKAYLVVPEAAAASAKGINIVVGNPTGVTEVKTAEETVNAPIYNIAGQKVTKNAKGIVIINGKAYINK